MTAFQYELSDGRSLFISDKSRSLMSDDIFLSGEGRLQVLEAVLNFEKHISPRLVRMFQSG